ncbi:MAG: hypothetical protein ACUVX8_05245, partial [Candidatus Zipacnadales bacterium]
PPVSANRLEAANEEGPDMYRAIVALITLACGLPSSYAATMRLATIPERAKVTLLLGAPPAALVEESRPLHLPAGSTSLEFSWTNTQLIADSLTLKVDDPTVIINGPIFPADQSQHAQWNLTCPQPITTPITIHYLINGLRWTPEYNAVLNVRGDSLSLEVLAVIQNDSGESFPNAEIDLGLSASVTADLENGTALKIPYIKATDVPCSLVYVFEGETSPDTQLRLNLRNTLEAGLGLAPLPAGKMRVYREVEGKRLFIGEVQFPHTPVGAQAKLSLGTAKEISVERQVLRLADVDIKKDIHGRMALWNREEDIALLIESLKNENILLELVERIEGEWQMLHTSHEFEKRDADHIVFFIPIPAHSEITVRYKVRRLNIMP